MILIVATCSLARAGTTNDITSYVQRGLFEEEANHNLDAAMQAYQSAVTLHDKDRKLVATAIFRLGECLRKEGKTNEASAYYQRVVTEFGDQQELAGLSAQYVGRPQQPVPVSGASSNNAALSSQLQTLSVETAQAEALWKNVARWKRFNNYDTNQLIKFFTTVEPDSLTIELARKRQQIADNIAQMPNINVDTNNVMYKAAQTTLAQATRDLNDRISTLVWGIEQKYQMLKDQEDALKERLGQGKASAAVAKEAPATSEEDEEIRKIKEMIQDSPDLINSPNQAGFTPLQIAAIGGHLKVAQYLVTNGANVNQNANINQSEKSPLMFAAENGHNALVEFLLSKGASVNAVSTDGRTALHYAAQHGFKTVVETLLKRGANVNAHEDDGTTAIWYAAKNGSMPILQLLLDHGADVNIANRESSPLLRATEGRHTDCVELLVRHKADVNYKDAHGETSLMAAAATGEMASAEILLKNGADSESQIAADFGASGRQSFYGPQNWANSGFRAINFAISKDNVKMLELLLEHHADHNSTFTWYFDISRANPGTTPLIMAVRHCENPAMIEVLLNHGADVNVADGQGATALHYAAGHSKTKFAEILLSHGAVVDAFNKLHQTPLYDAVSQQEPDTNMVALLIAHHADVNAPNKAGYPPIHAVMVTPATPQQKAVREQLIKAGADENFVRLKQISIRRNGHDAVVFIKGPNDSNHYTLLELISVVYGKNRPPEPQGRGHAAMPSIPSTPAFAPGSIPPPVVVSPPVAPLSAAMVRSGFGVSSGFPGADFQFPDFAHVKIKRISNSPLHNVGFDSGGERSNDGAMPSKSEADYDVDVTRLLANRNERLDVELEWGDIVEIPELDHAINAVWQGISPETQLDLMEMLKRPIEIKVKGTSSTFTVLPPMPICGSAGMLPALQQVYRRSKPFPTNALISPFGLRSVIDTAGVLRSSSDTAHIKISRVQNSNSRSVTVDLNQGQEPWIEPGDTIEIPDRDGDEAAK